jgi:short-subunit dehydrogenase
MLPGQFDVKGKTVVITGGSQGLGAQLAQQVFQRGAHHVVIMARTEANLKSTIAKIEQHRVNEEQKLEYRAVDLSCYEEAERALDGVEPDVVLFCAGASVPKLFTDLTPEELKKGIDINLGTAANVAHIAFAKMCKAGKEPAVNGSRHLVFCSSVLAVFPFIGYGQYAPSKAAIRALADVLRHEGAPFGIRVHTVFAGNFASEGFAVEEKTKPAITSTIEGASSAITVERCAQIVLWFLDHGYETIFTDVVGWVLYSGMLGFSPRVLAIPQAVLALLLALITPIYMVFVRRDVASYFNKSK